ARGPAELLDLAEVGVAALAERGTPFPEAEADLAMARAEAARHRGEDASALWRTAADRYTALKQPYPAAYARFRLAEAAARDRRTRTEATTTAGAAYQEAGRLGAARLAADLEALARRSHLTLAGPPARRTRPASAAAARL